jgi:hypothetical protein
MIEISTGANGYQLHIKQSTMKRLMDRIRKWRFFQKIAKLAQRNSHDFFENGFNIH